MPQTQDHIGPTDIPSGGDKNKGGRPLPKGQPKIGYPTIAETGDQETGGSIPPDLRKIGTQEATPAKSANPKRANDHIKPAKGASY